MMSPTKREALSVLAELCEMSPEIRLGQLMGHIGFLGEDQTDRSIGEIDDEQLLSVLYHHRTELVERSNDSAEKSQERNAAQTDALSH